MSSSHWISRSALHRFEVKQDPAPLPYLQEEHLGWALGCHIRLDLEAYRDCKWPALKELFLLRHQAGSRPAHAQRRPFRTHLGHLEVLLT